MKFLPFHTVDCCLDDLLMRFDYNPIMSQAEKEIEDPKVLQLAEKLEKEKV